MERKFYDRQKEIIITVTSSNKNDFMKALSNKIKESFDEEVKINKWIEPVRNYTYWFATIKAKLS